MFNLSFLCGVSVTPWTLTQHWASATSTLRPSWTIKCLPASIRWLWFQSVGQWNIQITVQLGLFTPHCCCCCWITHNSCMDLCHLKEDQITVKTNKPRKCRQKLKTLLLFREILSEPFSKWRTSIVSDSVWHFLKGIKTDRTIQMSVHFDWYFSPLYFYLMELKKAFPVSNMF